MLNKPDVNRLKPLDASHSGPVQPVWANVMDCGAAGVKGEMRPELAGFNHNWGISAGSAPSIPFVKLIFHWYIYENP